MKVPEYQGGIAIQGLPGARQTYQAPTVTADNFLGGTEKVALAAAGSALDSIGNAAQQFYAQQLHEANQTRITDVTTQLGLHVQDSLDSALNKRGADAFLGSEGKTVSDRAYDDVLAKQNSLADTLGNEQQRAQFKEQTSSMLMGFRGRLMGHEAGQHRVYTQSTLEANNAFQTMNIERNYNDPSSIKTSIAQLRANSTQLSNLHGNDSGWSAVYAQSNISAALDKAMDAATLNKDHANALKILHDFSPDMNQNDLLKNYQKIAKAQGDADVVNAVTRTMQSNADKFVPQDGDRLTNLRIGAESAHQHFGKDGAPTTSPAGAIGIQQIMPDTGPEAAKLAGVPWNKELFNRSHTGNQALDDEAIAYNNALGNAYYKKQLEDNHGDYALALASYNAGPGATRKAVKEAEKTHVPWLSLLPVETQNYVTNITAQYTAGGGKPPPATLQEIQQQTLAQLPNVTLKQRDAALQEASRQFSVNQAATKDHEDYNTAQAIIGLEANKGDFMGLPQAVREKIPPEKLKSLQAFAEDKVKGIPVKTDWPLYYNLYKDAPLLAATNLEAYKPQLADAEFKQLTARKVAHENGSDTTKTRTTKELLDSYMREVGIDPTPKDSDKAGAIKVGKIWSAFEQQLGDFEAAGKKATPDEIKTLAAKLFTTVGVKGLLYGTNEKMAVFLEPKDQVTVPAADRKQIIEGFKIKNPGMAVTEQDIFDLYIKHKGLN